jgi:hypothetical protein
LAFRRVNVTLDDDVHTVFQDEVGRQHVSEAFRLIEEELVNGPEEERVLSLRVRAKLVADRARKKLLEQRKIIQDREIIQEQVEKAARSRADLIREVTLAEVRAQKFTATYLPDFDDQYLTSEGIRKKLIDEIAHRCQIDLQWKDVEQYVRMAVRT